MISIYRAEADKYQDAHDFILMVKTHPELDKDRLVSLAQLIFAEAGKDIVEMVRRIQAGEKLLL